MKKLFTRPIPVLLLLFVLLFCEKEFDGERPFVRLVTLPPTDLNEEGVTLNGEFLDLSGGNVSDYGFLIDSKKIESDVVKNPDILKFSLKAEATKVGKFDYRLESNITKGVTFFVRAYAYQGSLLVLGEEFSFVSQGGISNPLILDFSPKDIVLGDTITITGKDFTLGLPKLTVKIGGQAAKILGSATNTSLKIQVPSGISLTGKIEVIVGSVELSSDKTYQRLKPVILNAPRTVRYGSTFFVECQNLSKLPSINRVRLGGYSQFLDCSIVEEQKNGLLCRLNDAQVYSFYDTGNELELLVESLSTSSKVNLLPPNISAIAPAIGIPGDEVTITGDGIASNGSVTVINWAGKDVSFSSIENGGKLIRLKIPPASTYPQEILVTVRSGQLVSNALNFRLDSKLLDLSQTQRNWRYAFSINNKVYIGTSTARAPFESVDPFQIPAHFNPVPASFDQTFEYAFPLQNNQIVALSRENTGAIEGHVVEVQSNNTVRLEANSANQIQRSTGAMDMGLIKGISLQHNKLAYLYVANGVQSFWEFNPNTRQFKALAPMPSENGAKVQELVLLDQGSKLIAVVSYVGNDRAQVLEYIPAINLWQKLYQMPFSGLVANDGFRYTFENDPGFYFVLSYLGQDQFALCSEEYLFDPNVPSAYRKQGTSSKKKVFSLKNNVIIIDDEHIYRTKLTIN